MKRWLFVIVLSFSSLLVYSQDGDTLIEPVIHPSFPGGEEAMYKFIALNLRIPHSAKGMCGSWRVFVKFLVKTDGSLDSIRVLKSPGYGMGTEAVRLIRSMPEWTPGRIYGRKVEVWFTLPVKFEIE